MIGGWGEFNRGTLLLLGDWGSGWLALFVIAALGVLAFTWLDLRDLRARRRAVLLGLRAMVLATGIFVALEPALELQHVQVVPNHIGVIVDTSRSQTLPSTRSRTRADVTLDAVRALESLSDEVGDEHRVHFVPLRDPPASARVEPGALRDAGSDAFETDGSALLETLRAFADEVGARDVGGFVILSDGIDTGELGERVRRGDPLDAETGAWLSALGAPVHTLATGNPGGLLDVAVRRVLRDDFAFVRNAVEVTAELRGLGLAGQTVEVTLYRDGQPLQTRAATFDGDTADARVTFSFVPERTGKEIYSVRVPPIEGEALTRNNDQWFVINVIRDRIRVLQVVGRPSWDVRFLRQFLTGNPNVDLISFFILRTTDDLRRTTNRDLSLIPFPTQELFEEQLGSFDVVVFQNFDYGPYEMARYLPRVREYVENGGGLLMLGGDLSFGSGGYAGTAVADVLPVRLPSTTAPVQNIDRAAFQPTLTEAGRRHPITRLVFGNDANDGLWESLPEMPGSNIVLGPSEGATVLASHPSRRTDEGPMPVLAIRDVGEGRSMALTVDGSWKWSFEALRTSADADPYASFYNAAIRWLIRDPELRLVRVELDQEEVPPGQPLSGTLQVFQPDYAPAEGATGILRFSRTPLASIQEPDASASAETFEVRFTTDARGRAPISFVPDAEGAWEVEAIVDAEDDAQTGLEDRDVFLSIESTVEFRDIEPRPELLRALSDATHGRHVKDAGRLRGLRFAPPRVEEVDRREVIQLWNAPWLFALLAALLALEWTLRRRWGRL